MNRPADDLPERLLAADATDFERRLLESVRDRKPSPASSARMARALGVTAAAVATTATAKTIAAEVVVSKAGAVAGAGAVWPWISVGVLALAVAGAVVGSRTRHATPNRHRAPAPVTAPSNPAPVAPTEPGPGTAEPPPSAAGPVRRSRLATAPELGDQIAFIDAARAALSAGADRRALETVRRYQERYPAGSFRPEATALKVEALVKLGRQAEARALAERFVAEHRGSLLAERVAALVGLARP
jgi:hypothetical protein